MYPPSYSQGRLARCMSTSNEHTPYMQFRSTADVRWRQSIPCTAPPRPHPGEPVVASSYGSIRSEGSIPSYWLNPTTGPQSHVATYRDTPTVGTQGYPPSTRSFQQHQTQVLVCGESGRSVLVPAEDVSTGLASRPEAASPGVIHVLQRSH